MTISYQLKLFFAFLLCATSIGTGHATAKLMQGPKRVMAVLEDHTLLEDEILLQDLLQITQGEQLPNDTPALCFLTDSLNVTGWYVLEIITNPDFDDVQQAYAAGLCEGAMTQQQTYDAFYNYFNSVLGGQYVSQHVQEFVDQQLYWLQMMTLFYPQDTYWQLVNLFLQQLRGLYDGYNQTQNASGDASQFLSFQHYYYLTNMGDLQDLIPAYGNDQQNSRVNREAQCNFFVRLTDKNLLSSHSTFNQFYFMLRIYKVYNFAYSNAAVKNRIVQFSSRPGDLESKDDWYIFNKLVVAETSLQNWNTSNFGYFHSNSVPCWLRVQLSNRVAESGPEWITSFQRYRSGTHNNQWIIVDYAAYRKQKGNSSKEDWSNILWMVEEFFYYYEPRDVTQWLLERGYVAGYNMPVSTQIYAASNISQSPWRGYDYWTTPRAVLFAKYYRYGGYLEGLQELLYLNQNLTGSTCNIASNDTAPFDENGIDSEIAVRCDYLTPEGQFGRLFGLVDGKITDDTLIDAGASWIRCGPTKSGFPYAFNWTAHESQPHRGQPLVFDFDWEFFQLGGK